MAGVGDWRIRTSSIAGERYLRVRLPARFDRMVGRGGRFALGPADFRGACLLVERVVLMAGISDLYWTYSHSIIDAILPANQPSFI
jgi:hypothetical protein